MGRRGKKEGVSEAQGKGEQKKEIRSNSRELFMRELENGECESNMNDSQEEDDGRTIGDQ
jgi:hypothetical protein